jgi:hypothetical protein
MQFFSYLHRVRRRTFSWSKYAKSFAGVKDVANCKDFESSKANGLESNCPRRAFDSRIGRLQDEIVCP